MAIAILHTPLIKFPLFFTRRNQQVAATGYGTAATALLPAVKYIFEF